MERMVDFTRSGFDHDPYSLGLMQGRYFRRQIKELYEIFRGFAKKQAKAKLGFFGGLLGDLPLTYFLSRGEKFEPFIDQDFRLEMQGLAEGARVDYRFIRILNVLDDVVNLSLCSAIGVRDLATSSYVYAANLDYPIFLETMRNNVFVMRKGNFITVGFPGYIGVLRGVNRCGLFLASLTSKTKKASNRFGIPNGLLYRKVINSALSVDEGLRLIESSTRRGASNNVLLGTRDEALLVEFNKDHVCEIGRRCNAVAVTNHFRSPLLTSYQEMVKPNFEIEVRYEHTGKDFSERRLRCLGSLDVSNLKEAFTNQEPLLNDGTVFTTLVDFSKNELIVVIPHRKEELIVPLTW